MKTLITILISIALAITASATTYDVRYGTIEASEGFIFAHTGTKDSFMGTLTRKTDGFRIAFDVGWSAGTHMHEGRKAKCTYFRKHSIGGFSATTGIENVADVQQIVTTVDYDAKTQRDPANFWAAVHKDSDIADFLLIATTYKPKSK
jgi:hypothetical protein